MFAFDSNLTPIVGQQVTLTDTNGATVGPRIDLLIARATAGDCDLIVKGTIAGEQRGWYRKPANVFQGDRAESTITDTALRALAAVAGQELTYTCVPPGSGIRMGVDRDADGWFDRVELDAGTDPADPLSFPDGSSMTTTTTTTTSTTLPTSPVVSIGTRTLSLRDRSASPANPAKRKVTFAAATKGSPAANRVVLPAPNGDGDPTLHGATLRVYNASGATADDVLVPLPTGWSVLGRPGKFKGYRYRASGSGDAVRAVTIKADTIVVKGGGAAWSYTLDEPAQGAIALRLRLGSGSEWCASASAKTSGRPPSTARTDRLDRFVGQPKAPAPATCPEP
jgi:hypothetical protein